MQISEVIKKCFAVLLVSLRCCVCCCVLQKNVFVFSKEHKLFSTFSTAVTNLLLLLLLLLLLPQIAWLIRRKKKNCIWPAQIKSCNTWARNTEKTSFTHTLAHTHTLSLSLSLIQTHAHTYTLNLVKNKLWIWTKNLSKNGII